MYYFVREGFQETAISEGFCDDLMLTSEMLNGKFIIDGQETINLGIGDRFRLTMDP